MEMGDAGSELVFYGYWDWRFVGLLAGSSVLNHFAALGMERNQNPHVRRTLLVMAGPIVRAVDLVGQLAKLRIPSTVDVGRASFLILGGL